MKDRKYPELVTASAFGKNKPTYPARPEPYFDEALDRNEELQSTLQAMGELYLDNIIPEWEHSASYRSLRDKGTIISDLIRDTDEKDVWTRSGNYREPFKSRIIAWNTKVKAWGQRYLEWYQEHCVPLLQSADRLEEWLNRWADYEAAEETKKQRWFERSNHNQKRLAALMWRDELGAEQHRLLWEHRQRMNFINFGIDYSLERFPPLPEHEPTLLSITAR